MYHEAELGLGPRKVTPLKNFHDNPPSPPSKTLLR